MTNLDSRIKNPEQCLTGDLDKWCNSFSILLSSLTKPFVDIILFSKKLSELVGLEGPLLMIGWYFLVGITIRFISPPFSKLTEIAQSRY